MEDVRDKMQRYVGEYKKYQSYLDRVVNETGEFQSINEIFNRYETLIEARQTLSDHQDRNLQLLEHKGTEIVYAIYYFKSLEFSKNVILFIFKLIISVIWITFYWNYLLYQSSIFKHNN